MRRRRPRDVATFAAPLQCVARRHGGAVARTVCVLDAVPLGFPIADVFRATFVGPSVNEVAAAIAGGTVGVMGTIIALETGRQRAVERKQCPYCRTSWRSSSNRISRFLTAAREGGTGKLPCGKCCALGVVPAAEIVGAQKPCEQCRNGYLRCNHVRLCFAPAASFRY